MRADQCFPGGPLMSVRTRGPLTPRRLLLSTPCGVMCVGEGWSQGRGQGAELGLQQSGDKHRLGCSGLRGGSVADLGQCAPDVRSPVVSSFARVLGPPSRLRVAAVDAESLVRAGVLQEVGGPLDRSAALWVSKKQLRDLGLYHREWVLVSSPSDGGTQRLAVILAAELWLGHPQKYSQLLSGGRRNPPGTALISATLSFNLTCGNGALSEVLVERFCNELTEGSRSALTDPPYAKELYIKIVRSPCYSSEASYQAALCHHFQTTRAVHVGDVLCVSGLSHADFLHNNSSIPVRCPDLYFKVCKVEGQNGQNVGYLADSAHTTLYQVGMTQSYVPSFPSRDGHVFWSSLSPAGLSHVVDEMCRLLQPHLQSSGHVLGAGGRILLCGPAGSGKSMVVRATCSRLHLHVLQVECARLCRESSAGTVTRLRTLFSRASDCRPCVLLLCHVDVIGRERDGSGEDTRVTSTLCRLLLDSTFRDWPMIVIATSCRAGDVSLDLQSCFTHEVSIHAPSEDQRLSMLTALSAPLTLSRDVSIPHLARRTAGFVVGDLCTLLTIAGRNACARIRKSCALTQEDEEDLLTTGFPITLKDLENALAEMQDSHSQAIGAPKVPSVHWRDVGGLHEAKRQLLDTVQLPLEHPEMLSLGLRRSGVLLFGPPGTGKTLLAKAVATECAMTFLSNETVYGGADVWEHPRIGTVKRPGNAGLIIHSVKGPELINMYVGQSEENVREVFCRARAAAPCVIFFDELDSLAPNRGKTGDSGGVMDRVVSQLLAEMDGLHSSNNVFVIGATNRPDLLDSALLRPGRFDKLVYVGINDDRDSQLRVLEAITHKFCLDPAVELSLVLEYCPPALTGADLYALCADAMMAAIKEKVQRLQEGVAESFTELVLRMEHLLQAAARLQPSVSQQDLQRYEKIRSQFSSNN